MLIERYQTLIDELGALHIRLMRVRQEAAELIDQDSESSIHAGAIDVMTAKIKASNKLDQINGKQ